jgi:putative ABC transport system ATP-binding protein
MSAVITLQGVSKGFLDGDRYRGVFADFDLSVAPGEIVAVCGPSGSGKSTLLNLVAGLLVVDDGLLNLHDDGADYPLHLLDEAARSAARRRLIGYVFQFFNLIPTLNVLENVRFPLVLNDRDDLLEQSRERLATLGLADRMDAFPDQLSGGERQRVAIARALAHEPPIVLADEPTGNLDKRNSEQVADLLWSEVERLGCVLLVATHSDAIAERAHRIVELG